MSKLDLTDRVAVVTGGAGGIGTCIAKSYAEAGASVVVASRKKENLDGVVGEIEAAGGTALAVGCDITVPDQVNGLIEETVGAFGRLDVMVNNAGGGATPRMPEDTPYDEWQRIVDLNLTGTWLCCIAAGKRMIEQQSGNIINISSVAGTKGHPGMLHYSAAKAGVISLSNNLAFQWAKHNIRVNCVAPGLIATPRDGEVGRHPAGREGGRHARAASGAAARPGGRRRPLPFPRFAGLGPADRRGHPDPLLDPGSTGSGTSDVRAFIRPLDTRDDDLDLLGGKGRSLARLSNAGFAVPGGFHVTTAGLPVLRRRARSRATHRRARGSPSW